MAKYDHPEPNEDGWSDPIFPESEYKMACCDCGLVHNVAFTVVEVTKRFKNGAFLAKPLRTKKYRVAFKVSRNNRATGQVRRGMKNK